MIKDYLGRVSVAATKVLPKGDRLLFVGRTRAAIEAKVGPLASADADDVLNALTTLGDPEVLAKRERERLYSARRRGAAAEPPTLWKPSKEPRRGAAPPPPPAGRRLGPGQARKPRPWPHRGLTGPSEPPPADAAAAEQEARPADAAPSPAVPPETTRSLAVPPATTPSPAVPPGTTPPAPPSRLVPFVPRQAESPEAPPPPAGPATAGPAAPDTARDAAAAAGPAAGVAGNGQAAPGLGGPGEDGPIEAAPGEGGPIEAGSGEDGSGQAGSGEDGSILEGTVYAGQAETAPEPGGTPPGWMRPRPTLATGEATPLSIVPGMEQPAEEEELPLTRRRPPPAPITEAWALARKHPLEAVSVILLGVGGLILPFPFWLIGGLVALRSRRWDARDKWMALAGPLLVTLVVLLIRAGTSPDNFFPAFYHAAQHDFGLSIRAGCVLCAGYLVWRLRRGPRLRTLPPWQRPR
jgi:hypothetical protein